MERSAKHRRRVLTLAHLTDIHLTPERRSPEGLAACLRHVQQHPARPELILNGGDCVMDASGRSYDEVHAMWKLWHEVWREENSLPVVHCLGNHDAFGWNHEKSGATGREPEYGMAWAMDELELSRRYYSVDCNGWRLIVLDSTHRIEPFDRFEYRGRLDEDQFAWLEGELEGLDPATPALILSHIPILSACAYFDGPNEQTGNWQVPGAWMHIDARRLKNLFLRFPNVKLCISGHLHLVDRVEYAGVAYCCNGAVSANWWKGTYYECDEGYAIVRLYDDGSFDNEYIAFGWQAPPMP